MPRGGSRRGRDSRSDYARARSIKVVRLGDNARFVLLARSGRTLLAHQDEGFRERGVSVSLGFDPRSLWQNVADFAVGDLERFEIRELHANPRRSRGWSRTVRRGKHNMKSRTAYLTFNLPARIAFENITSKVEAVVRQSGVTEGLVLCNAMHRSRPARASLSCSTARVCLSSGPVRGRPRSPVAAASVAGGRAPVAVIGVVA